MQTKAITIALATLLWSVCASAQIAPADLERDLRAWGVATLPQIDALGEKLIPYYMPGQGMTPIDLSKCTQALPLLIEFGHKTQAAAALLAKMAEQLMKIERLSALSSIQGEISRLRDWAAVAMVDEGRCLVAAGDRTSAAIRFAQAIDLSIQGEGGRAARDALAELLEYQN
jgi:hypothetical protein